jgi:TonB family protein
MGFFRLRGFRKGATRLTEPPVHFTSSSARWYLSGTVPGPVTYGWLRPSILLPERVMRLPSSQREAIACHELMHVLRRDWLFVLAEEAVRSLLWFHPAVWYVLSRIQLAREQVVDSEVVRLTADRDGYLEALVEVAAQRLLPDLAPAPLFLRKRQLAVRVAAVLKEVSMSKSRIAARLAAVCSAMVLAARVAIWFVPFVSPAQTVLDDPGVTVDAGATLLHRASVRNPAGASGTVTLEASVNSKGEVTDAHVLSGPDDLRKEALSSVLQWHYTPGLSRVQISMRFEPAAPASPAPPTPRSVTVTAASPPPQNARLSRIDVVGFSAEADRELRSRLPVHEGDTVTAEAMTSVSAVVKDFDSHARVGLSKSGNNGELALRISVSPLSIAAVQPPAPPAPSTDSPAPRMIDGTVMQATRIKIVTPVYPALAKTARIQGDVKFLVTIAADGTVQDAELESGQPLLAEAAKDAVMQWVYKPVTLNGEPVSVKTDVTVHFTLAQ